VPGPNPTNNYVGSFNFLVKVEGFTTELDGFTSCSGVKSVTEVYDFKHGYDTHIRRAIGRTSFEPVVLERAYSGLDEFAAWRDRIEAGADDRKEVIIEYRTANHKLVSRFRLQNAFPSRWESPDLNAMGSDAAIERIELSYERAIREVSGSHLLEKAWWAPAESSAPPKPKTPPNWKTDMSKPRQIPKPQWVTGENKTTHKPRQMNYPDWVLKY
jgi:phage tail-like protein